MRFLAWMTVLLTWAASVQAQAAPRIRLAVDQVAVAAGQAISVDVNQQISITAALAEAQRRVIDVVATQLEDQSDDASVLMPAADRSAVGDRSAVEQ